MGNRVCAILVAAVAAVAAGCNGAVSEDIRVLAGTTSHAGAISVNGDVLVAEHVAAGGGAFRTVNGDIHIGAGAQVDACTSVHGRITVGEGARTGPLEAVNGDLAVARAALVNGPINLVNGRVSIEDDVRVVGGVGTVNGEIKIRGSVVGGDVVNYNGAITLTEGTEVLGDVIVRDTVGVNGQRVPRVVIGPNSVVAGRLVFERPVRLYIHETATVADTGGFASATFSTASWDGR